MRGHELLDKMELAGPAYLDAADKSPASRKRRWLKYGMAAACLCAVLLVSFLRTPKPDNAFFVKAYELALTDDGTVELKETDLLDLPDVWDGYFNGENFYLSVGLRYDGSNIKSVAFITEEGFFAKQYIGNLADEEHVTRMYAGAENRLVMYGTEFEIVGDMITLDDKTMTDDLLLFWGTRAADMSEVPEHIEIKAVAAFRDGRTQEVTVPIDLSGAGAGTELVTFTTGTMPDEEIQRWEEKRNYYDHLPLEECELLEETVETVTNVYEYNIGTITDQVPIYDEMEFDENGICRNGIRGEHTEDGYVMYMPVIRRDENGVYTGMVYRVPEDLYYPEG